jgi:hypothetical protein
VPRCYEHVVLPKSGGRLQGDLLFPHCLCKDNAGLQSIVVRCSMIRDETASRLVDNLLLYILLGLFAIAVQLPCNFIREVFLDVGRKDGRNQQQCPKGQCA